MNKSFEYKCPECDKVAIFVKLDYMRYQCQRCGNIFINENGKLENVGEERE